VKVRKPDRIVCAVIIMRTSRLAGAAAAVLVTLAMSPPAAAQPSDCPPPGLGPPTTCVVDSESETPVPTIAPDDPLDREPGAALWVGGVFGAAGLAGIALATARVRDDRSEER